MELVTAPLRALMVAIDSVHLDASNARTHDDRQLHVMAESLKRFGQTKPIVVQESSRKVVAGNATLAAARQLGWTRIAINALSLSDQEADAYAIADNRTAELSDWDYAVLSSKLRDLGEAYALDGLGWSEAELAPILAGTFAPAPLEELPVVWVSERFKFYVRDEELARAREVLSNRPDPDAAQLEAIATRVSLTPDQYKIVQAAIDKVRAAEGQISPGRALELVCAEFLS